MRRRASRRTTTSTSSGCQRAASSSHVSLCHTLPPTQTQLGKTRYNIVSATTAAIRYCISIAYRKAKKWRILTPDTTGELFADGDVVGHGQPDGHGSAELGAVRADDDDGRRQRRLAQLGRRVVQHSHAGHHVLVEPTARKPDPDMGQH